MLQKASLSGVPPASSKSVLHAGMPKRFSRFGRILISYIWSIKKRTEYFHIQSFFAVTSYYTLFFVCMGCYTFPIVCIFKDILHFLNHLLHGMGHEILIYIRHLLRGNRHSLSDPYLDRKTHGSRVILRQHIGSHPRKTSVFVA